MSGSTYDRTPDDIDVGQWRISIVSLASETVTVHHNVGTDAPVWSLQPTPPWLLPLVTVFYRRIEELRSGATRSLVTGARRHDDEMATMQARIVRAEDLDRLREEVEMIGGSIEAERDHYRDAVQRAAILTGVKRGPNEDLAAWLMRALGDVSEQPVTPVLERIRRLERSPARRGGRAEE